MIYFLDGFTISVPDGQQQQQQELHESEEMDKSNYLEYVDVETFEMTPGPQKVSMIKKILIRCSKIPSRKV